MKVNLQSLSIRAQNLLQNPLHFSSDLAGEFKVTMDTNDRILTVVHGMNKDNYDFLLAEVVAKFSEKKSILDLWKINFREIESFLRDENHLPAFATNTAEIEAILGRIKILLVGSAVKSKLNSDLSELISQRKNWNLETLVGKNQWAQKIISPLNWQLILCEGDVLTVTGTPSGVDQEGLSHLINTILGGADDILPMKVVAV